MKNSYSVVLQFRGFSMNPVKKCEKFWKYSQIHVFNYYNDVNLLQYYQYSNLVLIATCSSLCVWLLI